MKWGFYQSKRILFMVMGAFELLRNFLFKRLHYNGMHFF